MANRKNDFTFRFNVDLKSIDTICDKLDKMKTTVQKTDVSKEISGQMQDASKEIEELRKRIEEVNDAKLDKTTYKKFAEEIQQYVNAVNNSFTELYNVINKIGDTEGLSVLKGEMKSFRDDCIKTMSSITATITEGLKDIQNAKVNMPKLEVVDKEQISNVKAVADATEKETEAHKKNAKAIQEETKAKEEQYDVERDIKKVTKPANNKKTNTNLKKAKAEVSEVVAEISSEEGNKIPINITIPKGTDEALLKSVNEIIDAINETNPTIKVGVKFASDYNTRQKRQAVENIQKDLDEAMSFAPKGKEAKAQFVQTVEGLRKELIKALRHDDSDAMFQFSTNVVEIGQQIEATVESVSKALGQFPLYANVVLNEEQIQEELAKMKDLSLTINTLDFSKSFIDSLDATEAIAKIQGEINEIQGPDPLEKNDSQKQLDDLLSKVKKVKDLASSLGKHLEAVTLSGEFDKDQLQDALDNITGLVLKIDKLDVSHIQGMNITGTIGGAGNGINYVSSGINYVPNGVGSGDNIPKEGTKTYTEEAEAHLKSVEAVKKLNPEMEKFISNAERGAKSLIFNPDGTLNQGKEGRSQTKNFLRKFVGSKFGLIDWAVNTQMLGTGETFNNNLKLLEGMQASMAHDSKIPHPKVLIYDQNFFQEKKGGGLKKKGNEKALETLFSSMRLYGVNKDAEHSVSEMLRNIRNKQTRQEVLDAFYAQNPNYVQLRTNNAKINTPSPEKRQSYKKVLAPDVEEKSKVVVDKLDDLNRDVIQYLEVADKPIEDVDKALKERMAELQQADYLETEEGRRYKYLSSDYAEQKNDFEEKVALGTHIFGGITAMSPEEIKSIDAERYPQLARFVSSLEKNYPERWENLNKVREQKIDEELTRRLKRVERFSKDGEVLESDENEKAIQYFIDEFFKTLPDLTNEGPYSFKNEFKNRFSELNFSEKSIARFEAAYKEKRNEETLNAMPLEDRIKTLLRRIKLDDNGEVKQSKASTENINRIFKSLIDAEVITAETGLEEAIKQYNIPASIGNALKQKQEDKLTEELNKKLQEEKEKAQQENKKKARIKTNEEKIKEAQDNKKKSSLTKQQKEVEKTEVVRREGYDDFFSDAQYLSQRVIGGVDTRNLSDTSVDDITEQLQRYYDKLAYIKRLKKKIDEFRKDISQKTGKKKTGKTLTDEEILGEIFPASPESANAVMVALKRYDEYYDEASRLIYKQRELTQKKKVVKSESKINENILSLNDDQIKSISGITDKLSVTESGAIEDTKQNQEQIKNFSEEVYNILQQVQAEAIQVQTQQLQKELADVDEELKQYDSNQLQEEKSKLEGLIKQLNPKSSKYQDRYDTLITQQRNLDARISAYHSLSERKRAIETQLSKGEVSPTYLTKETLADAISVPGIEQFNQKIKELRAVGRQLGDEFDKLSLQMEEVGKGTEEYVALENKRNEVNQKINENDKAIEQIRTSRGAYEDAFYSSVVDKYYEQMKDVGVSAPQGYIEGVQAEETEVQQAVSEVIKAGIEAAEEAQDSHSPSREYYQLGNWAIDGYVDAIKENLPLIQEVASQIKFNPDGTIDQSAKNVALANQFIDALKQYGAIRVARVSPFEDWQGNKGLKTLLNELPRTAKTGQIKKGSIDDFSPLFEKYIDSYGIKIKNKKPDLQMFNAVMKEMGVNDKDLAILQERFTAYISKRADDINKERGRIKEIVNSLQKNTDNKTISRKNGVNDSKFKEIYAGYISTYKNAITKEGVNESTFKKFAKDMGLSEDNASRLKIEFDKIFEDTYAHIEKTRQECLSAAQSVSNAVNDNIKDSGDLESKTIEDNKDAELKATQEETEARKKALEDEKKERQQLIEDLEKLQRKTDTYMPEYRNKINQAIDTLRSGGDLQVGRDIVQSKGSADNLVYKNWEEQYYKLTGGVNRILSNKDVTGSLRQEVEEFSDALKQLDPQAEISQKTVKHLRAELSRFNSETDKVSKGFFNTVVERLRKANADFFARYLSIRDIIRYFREFMQTVTELDTALTEMRKVSDESVASLREYQRATFDVASALGTTAVQVQQSTADWMRLGETMEEAAKSAKAATTLLNVSEFENINDATTALVAMSQAYKDLDKTEIIDVLNNIGNNYSIATDQLATALQASSAALMTQGNDLYEAAALVTAGNAIIQDASKTGTGIRTIALRIAGQKLGTEELKEQLDELGEEVDEWVLQTESKKRQAIMEYTKVAANDYKGVDILDANGNLKDTYHILLEISKVYKDIQEEDKKLGTNRAQGLVEELAGKVRSNIAASILMNPQMLEDVYNDALNSMGSAAEENAKYLDSIAGKTQQLKNEWQEFQFNMLNSEFLKNMIDLLQGLLEVVNKLGDKLPVVTAALGAFAFAIMSASKGLFVLKGGALGAIPKFFAGLIATLKAFTGAEVMAEEAVLATNVALGAQNFILGAGFIAILTAAAYGIYKLATREKDLEKAANDARDSIKQTSDSLKSMEETVEDSGKRYAQLAQRVHDLGKATQSQGTLSTDEYKEFLEISDELANLFPSLTKTYDENQHAILDLNGGVNTIVGSLEDLVDVEKELAQIKMLDDAKAIYEDDFSKYQKYKKELDVTQAIASGAKDSPYGSGRWAMRNGVQYTAENDDEAILLMSDVEDVFKKVFGEEAKNKIKQVQSPLDRMFGRGKEFDFSNLTEEDKQKLDDYFKTVGNTYEQDAKQLENSIATVNADFAKYMSLALVNSNSYANSSDKQKKIIEGLISDFDMSQIPEDKEEWDEVTAWFESEFIFAISRIDDKKIVNEMYDALYNSALTSAEKANLMQDIINALIGAGYSEDDPFVLHWKSQYDGATKQMDDAVNHILPNIGMQEGDTSETVYAKAREWVGKLNSDQISQIMNISIDSQTINSYDELLDLLKEINEQTEIYRYQNIGSLLSQNSEVYDYQAERYKALQEEYDRELALAQSMGAELDKTIYGNVDLNNRSSIEWNTENLEKYKDAIESWGESVEDFEGTISTVFSSSSEFDGVEIAFTPMLQTEHGAELLDSDTVYRYIDTLISQMPEGWTNEDLLKLDATGIEINGKKIQGLIAGIGDEAIRVSETMHYLGTDGSLALLQKQMDEIKSSTVDWGQIRKELVGLAQAGKLDEDTLRNYQYFDEILKELGLTTDVTDEQLQAMINDINSIAVKNAVDDLSNYKTEVDKLGDAYSKFQKGEFIDANTLGALQDAFGDLDSYQEFEQAVLSGETDLQKYFDNIVTEYANQHQILNELKEDNKEWVKQQLVASGITKDSADKAVEDALKYKKTLENEVRTAIIELNTNEKIAKSKENLAIDTANLDKVTIQEVSALLAETEASGEAAEKIKYFAIQKELSKMTAIRNNDDIDYLIQICELAELGTSNLEKLKRMNANYDKWDAQKKEAENRLDELQGKNDPGSQQARAYWNNQLRIAKQGMADVNELKADALGDVKDAFGKKYQDYEYKMDVGLDYSGLAEDAENAGTDAAEAFKDALDKILAMYDAELDAGVTSFKDYVAKSRAIIEQYYNDGKIKASDYYNYLADLYQKQVSEYDKVISAVQRLIKKQTDELEKQKESIEESYNLQIEEIQKKIDALQDENDEIDKNIALQKAQYELARAQNQRTKLMYSEARGFYYEADLKGVHDAEEQVRKAQLDKVVSDLEKQIKILQDQMKSETDEIDKQIKALNEYGEKWGEVSNKLQEAIEDQRAAEILGQDWEKQILDQRLDTLQNFTDQYIALQQAQKDAALAARQAEVAEAGQSVGGTTVTKTDKTNTEGDLTQKQKDRANNAMLKGVNSGASAITNLANNKGKYMYNGKIYSSATEAQAAQRAYIDSEGSRAYNQAMQQPIPDQAAKKANAEQARKRAEAEARKKQIRALYSGTDSAKPGNTIVGEKGNEIVVNNDGTATIVDSPTIMKMKGGEKVFNADETDEILKKSVPLKSFNPTRFKLLQSFASGTSSPMQTRIAAQAVGLANGITTGMFGVPNAGGQTVNNTFNVSLPNITDASKATDLFKEFQHLQMKATQYFNK